MTYAVDYEVHLRVKDALVQVTVKEDDPAKAVRHALHAVNDTFDCFLGVYLKDPTPAVPAQYGAPLGRVADCTLDPDGTWKATEIELDEGGYDPGGAYWGLRMNGDRLYAIEDGSGGLMFVDVKPGDDPCKTLSKTLWPHAHSNAA